MADQSQPAMNYILPLVTLRTTGNSFDIPERIGEIRIIQAFYYVRISLP